MAKNNLKMDEHMPTAITATTGYVKNVNVIVERVHAKNVSRLFHMNYIVRTVFYAKNVVVVMFWKSNLKRKKKKN